MSSWLRLDRVHQDLVVGFGDDAGAHYENDLIARLQLGVLGAPAADLINERGALAKVAGVNWLDSPQQIHSSQCRFGIADANRWD